MTAPAATLAVAVRTRYLWWPRFLVWLTGQIMRYAPLTLPVLPLCEALFALAYFQLRIDGGTALSTRWRWYSIGQVSRRPQPPTPPRG